jgi:hypothetical protein
MSWREFLHRKDTEDTEHVSTSVCIVENSLRRDTEDTNGTEHASKPAQIRNREFLRRYTVPTKDAEYRIDDTEHASTYTYG